MDIKKEDRLGERIKNKRVRGHKLERVSCNEVVKLKNYMFVVLLSEEVDACFILPSKSET